MVVFKFRIHAILRLIILRFFFVLFLFIDVVFFVALFYWFEKRKSLLHEIAFKIPINLNELTSYYSLFLYYVFIHTKMAYLQLTLLQLTYSDMPQWHAKITAIVV